MKSRREARETVFELLFEWSFKEESTMGEIIDLAIFARELETNKFITELAYATYDHMQEIDMTIEKYSTNWKKNRISKICLAALRMALGELMFLSDIPEGATINEAVELVKKYGIEEESAFLNGILGNYSRDTEKTESK